MIRLPRTNILKNEHILQSKVQIYTSALVVSSIECCVEALARTPCPGHSLQPTEPRRLSTSTSHIQVVIGRDAPTEEGVSHLHPSPTSLAPPATVCAVITEFPAGDALHLIRRCPLCRAGVFHHCASQTSYRLPIRAHLPSLQLGFHSILSFPHDAYRRATSLSSFASNFRLAPE